MPYLDAQSTSLKRKTEKKRCNGERSEPRSFRFPGIDEDEALEYPEEEASLKKLCCGERSDPRGV